LAWAVGRTKAILSLKVDADMKPSTHFVILLAGLKARQKSAVRQSRLETRDLFFMQPPWITGPWPAW
jgi:hypothetical protein